MTLAHHIELDTTARQREYFAQAAGTSRFVYNWALAERKAQYELGGKPKANELKRYFNAIKYERFPWLKAIHRGAHSQPFANLNRAFAAFFAGTGKYPKFKKKGKSRDSFYLANDKTTVSGATVKLPVIGSVRLAEELRFTGKIQSATVSREADRWFISIAVEMPDAKRPAPPGEPIGIDLGLTAFATLSTGEKIDAPKPLRWAQRKLKRLGHQHSRKKLKSANRRKAALKLARQHRRIKNIRQDFLHEFTTRMAKRYSEICIEDLNVKGMTKNHSLALHVSDAAWGETRRQLTCKAALYGSTLTVRDRFFASSKLCSACGEKADSMSLSVREWTCADCGAVHGRDENAAKNLVQKYRVGFTRIYASRDCGADERVAGRETAVVERGTIPEDSLVLTT